MKKATTVEEQINILKKRGILIDVDENKAKEILLDIGYFRFGFYCFPFEKTYPKTKDRDHVYKDNTRFRDVVELYYLDVNLRLLLTKYINRIEVNFRTKVTYAVSLSYQESNTWFVDPNVMTKRYIDEFDSRVYNDAFKRNRVITLHHKKYINDRYAPAWKTMEFVTFGGILSVFKNLRNESVKEEISKFYGINNPKTMANYIDSIVQIRNVCAHGAALFDFTLPKSLKKGPAINVTASNKNKLCSVFTVIQFILNSISENRAKEMKDDLEALFNKYEDCPVIKNIITNCIGYEFKD